MGPEHNRRPLPGKLFGELSEHLLGGFRPEVLREHEKDKYFVGFPQRQRTCQIR